MYEIMTKDKVMLFENLPVLDDNHNISRYDFHLKEEDYKKINKLIYENPGGTLKEYVDKIDFYDFNEKSLESALLLFNKYKNTFHNVCGPFVLYDNRWYPAISKNISYKNKYLSQEIDSKLNKIKKLKKMEKEMMDRLNNLSQIYR